MKELRIVALTEEEMLNKFWNTHLEKATSHRINVKIWGSMGPDEVAGLAQVPMGNNQLPGTIEVKVKDALKEEKEKLKSQERILDAISEMKKHA